MDTKSKWTEEVLLCGSWAPCTAEVDYISQPMSYASALAQMAICDSQMQGMGVRYVYIIDCKGNILLDKWV